MPHDAHGSALKVGDKVIIPATITELQQGEGECNCAVEFEFPMPPNNTKTIFTSLNTKQVELVESAEAEEPGAVG